MTYEQIIEKAAELLRKGETIAICSEIESMAIKNGIYTEAESYGAGGYAKVNKYWDDVYAALER